MNWVTSNAEPYLRQFEALAASLPGAGQAAVVDRRRRALARFASKGLPTLRDEAWRYSAKHPALKRILPIAPRAATNSAVAWPGIAAPTVLTISFVDGHYERTASSLEGELAAHGVEVLPWAGVLESGSVEYLDWSDSDERDGYAELNFALQQDGALIRLAAGACPPPLEVRCLATTSAGEVARSLTLCIELAAGARLTLLESQRSEHEAKGSSLTTTRLRLARDAYLEHVLLAEQGSGMHQFVDLQAQLAQGAALYLHSLCLGNDFYRYQARVDLQGGHAHANANGLSLLDARQHADHALSIHHGADDGRSEMYFRNLLSGHSRGIFSGKAIVPPGVKGSVARQSNDNLLLSPHAEADSRPELSIENDAVECSHGATVGQLDDVALFYLRSRGLDLEVAKSVLAAAFALTVVQRIQDLDLAAYARSRFRLALPQAIDLEGLA